MPKMKVYLNGAWTVMDAGNADTATKLQTARGIALSGDVTATAVNFDGSAGITLSTALANSGVTAGTYKSVTVDAKGRVTGGTNPTTLSGYGITDAAPSSHIGATGNAHGVVTTSVNGFMSSTDKSKLDGIASSAEVNQNTFSNIAVSGQSTISADAKTDTLTLANGTNITITTNTTTDTVTIATSAEVNQNTFSNVKVGATTISADSKTDTIELVQGNGISLTPDATNDKVTFAIDDAIVSDTEPTTGLYDGLKWYAPTADEIKIYFSGAFRSAGGGASASITSERNETVTIASDTNTVAIPGGFNASGGDILLLRQNTAFIQQPSDYTIVGTNVVKTSGNWAGGSTTLDFTIIGAATVPATGTLTMAQYTGSYTATGGETNVPINIDGGVYNSTTDLLDVYQENVPLYKGDNYTLGADGQSIDLTYVLNAGDKIYYKVTKKIRDSYVGSVDGADILDGTIVGTKITNGVVTKVKLSTDVIDSNGKFIGDITGNSETVGGKTVSDIQAGVKTGARITVSVNTQIQSLGEKSSGSTDTVNGETVKRFQLPYTGTFRVYYDFKGSGAGTQYCSVLKAGASIGIQTQGSSTTYSTKSIDITGVAGDVWEVRLATSGVAYPAYVKNVKVCYDIVTDPVFTLE